MSVDRRFFTRASFVRALAMSMVAMLLAPAAALAADCEISVFNAYTTAIKRGWQFECDANSLFSASFVTYPSTTIGCTWKTPPVVPPGTFILAFLFKENASLAGNSLHSRAPTPDRSHRRYRIGARAGGSTRKAYGFRSYRCIEIALYHPLGQLPEPKVTHRFC